MTQEQIKSLIEMVSEDKLTNFVKSVMTIEDMFKEYRKEGVKGSEFKPDYFDKIGKLNSSGLDYTRSLINSSQALQNAFFSYLSCEKIC